MLSKPVKISDPSKTHLYNRRSFQHLAKTFQNLTKILPTSFQTSSPATSFRNYSESFSNPAKSPQTPSRTLPKLLQYLSTFFENPSRIHAEAQIRNPPKGHHPEAFQNPSILRNPFSTVPKTFPNSSKIHIPESVQNRSKSK